MKPALNPYHVKGPFSAAQPVRVLSRARSRARVTQHFASQPLAERGSMEIADWRNRIDELDEQIVRLLSERAAAAVAIGKLKAQRSAPIYEPQREQAVFEHVRRVNPGPLSGAQVQDVYERLMDVMRALQRQP
jgi:chorismate mutase